MHLRPLFRLGRAAAALAVASLLLAGRLPSEHGDGREAHWEGPGHEAVLADTGPVSRANALLTGKPEYAPHHLSADFSAGSLDSSRTRLVLERTRPGGRRPAPRLLRRVPHADGDPPA